MTHHIVNNQNGSTQQRASRRTLLAFSTTVGALDKRDSLDIALMSSLIQTTNNF
ncbi:hypothetical protein [Undibacterium sp. Tian12W]|uniref:hypothetical protein n=1 Tax=Undibacterium sp. Tian12W TaxID=3413054 RepID=UPI003BF22748